MPYRKKQCSACDGGMMPLKSSLPAVVLHLNYTGKCTFYFTNYFCTITASFSRCRDHNFLAISDFVLISIGSIGSRTGTCTIATQGEWNDAVDICQHDWHSNTLDWDIHNINVNIQCMI